MINWKDSRKFMNRVDAFMRVNASSMAPTRIYYDPALINEEAVKNSIRTLEVANQADQHEPLPSKTSRATRHKAKYRCLVSDSFIFHNGAHELKDPAPVKILSGCMPNLWGSYEDERAFIDAQGNLKAAAYKQMCETLLVNWLAILKQEGATKLALPLLGGGVYLNRLSDSDKLLAQKIIVDSIAFAAKQAGFVPNAVTLCLPSPKKPNTAQSNLTSYVKSNLKGMIQLDQRPNALFDRMARGEATINPGSDRSIGGGREACAKQGKRGPLEEQEARITTLVPQQAYNGKLSLAQSGKFKIIQRPCVHPAVAPQRTPVQLPAPVPVAHPQPRVAPAAPASSFWSPPSLNLLKAANKVMNAESLWKKAGNVGIVEVTFKSSKEAGKFYKQLTKSGITSSIIEDRNIKKLGGETRWKVNVPQKVWDNVCPHAALPSSDQMKPRVHLRIDQLVQPSSGPRRSHSG